MNPLGVDGSLSSLTFTCSWLFPVRSSSTRLWSSKSSVHVALGHRELRDGGDLPLHVPDTLRPSRSKGYVDLHALLELLALLGRARRTTPPAACAPSSTTATCCPRSRSMPFSIRMSSTRPPNRLTTSASAPPAKPYPRENLPLLHVVPDLYPDIGYEPRGLGHRLAAGIAAEQDALVAAHLGRDGAENAPDDGRRDESQQPDEGQPAPGRGNPHQPVELVRRQHLVHRLFAKQGFLHDPSVPLRHPFRRPMLRAGAAYCKRRRSRPKGSTRCRDAW